MPAASRYDADKFNWLGSTGPQNEVILVWHTAGITTHRQATGESRSCSAAPARAPASCILPMVMNNLLGTKFKIVTGYRTSEDVNLGMERGEVQARAFGIDSITSQHPDWISEPQGRLPRPGRRAARQGACPTCRC